MRLTLALAAVLWTSAASASPEGVWQTESTEDGRYLYIKVHACDQTEGRLCGTIVEAFGDVPEKVIGLNIIWDMTPDGNNHWNHGKILGVKQTIYDSEMKLLGDGRLNVSGCTFAGLVCKSQAWQRVD